MKKERFSNIELLRIFAMLLIIAFHYAFKGGFVYESISVNKMIINLLTMFGELGVNLFVLISGYFMVNGTFRWKKVISICLQVCFYNWLSLLILNGGSISAVFRNAGWKDYFPSIYGIYYWFTTSYILLYIVSPYLNYLVKSLSRKEYEKMLMIFLILWCVIPTFFGMKVDNTESLLNYNRFIWMIIVYLAGAYIALYKDEIRLLSYKVGIYFAGSFLMLFLVTAVILFMEWHLEFFQMLGVSSATYFWRPNSILIVIWSFLIFMAFLKLDVPYMKWINGLASTTLGIYMLHDGRLDSFWWKNVFKNVEYTHSEFLIVHIIVTVIVIFVVGAAVDLVRQILVHLIARLFTGKLTYKILGK